MSKRRTYLDFNPATGYPAGKNLFYQCLRCAQIVPSLPDDSTHCKCWNIRIDIDYGRLSIEDPSLARLFTEDLERARMSAKYAKAWLRWGVVVIAIVASSFILFAWQVRRIDRQLTPPSHVTDLRSFLRHMPPPVSGCEIQVGDEWYLELSGQLAPTYMMPSGPPAYVFDESFRLVDWTTDDGDDGEYQSKWWGVPRRELTADELTELLELSLKGE